MLEQLIVLFNGNCNPIRTYSIKDLNRATNKFHSDGLLHWDMHYDMYRGVHQGHEISVKMFKFHEESTRPCENPVELIVNELAIASQMSKHKNVLKLLGCCLETEFPILVYEFPANGNLEDAITDKDEQLPWEMKLKIATQVARAVSYLHHGLSKIFIHRVIRIGSIFLDKDCVAKLSDFQTCLPIPEGETHVEAQEVIGHGKPLAPELFKYRYYTEKTDVYSFGWVLHDMLAGQNIDQLWQGQHSERSYASIGGILDISDVELSVYCSGGILDISDDELSVYCSGRIMVNPWCESRPENESVDEEAVETLSAKIMQANNKLREGNRAQVMECVNLIERCLKINPNERPNMVEVTKTLEFIRNM